MSDIYVYVGVLICAVVFCEYRSRQCEKDCAYLEEKLHWHMAEVRKLLWDMQDSIEWRLQENADKIEKLVKQKGGD